MSYLHKAKRIHDEKWIEGNLIVDENREKYIVEQKAVVQDGHHIRIDSDDPVFFYQHTFCQGTGMYDKNFVQIYEKDIVKLNNLGYRNRGVYGKVEFNDGCFEVVGDGWRDYLKCYVANHSVEVCGNIFDNPELLEV